MDIFNLLFAQRPITTLHQFAVCLSPFFNYFHRQRGSLESRSRPRHEEAFFRLRPWTIFPLATWISFSIRFCFLIADSASATNFICVITRSSASTTTRSAWCSPRWRIIRSWSDMPAATCPTLRQTTTRTTFPRQCRRRFSRTDTITVCWPTSRRRDLRTTTWTTTKMDWTASHRHSERQRTWSRSSRPTEIRIHAGPNGMAKSVSPDNSILLCPTIS